MYLHFMKVELYENLKPFENNKTQILKLILTQFLK